MSRPSIRIPVPQSRTIMVPSLVRISTHEVLPPYIAVRCPGVGIEPRVPQKRRCIIVLFYPVLQELGIVVLASAEHGYSQPSMFQSSAFRPQIAAALAVLYSALYPHGMLYDERPWGNFTVLDEASNYKVKRIEVLPQKRLSYQKHARRSEHWMVVAGVAKVTLDGCEITIQTGETVD